MGRTNAVDIMKARAKDHKRAIQTIRLTADLDQLIELQVAIEQQFEAHAAITIQPDNADEIEALQQRADELGIVAGRYEGWQVVSLIADAVANRDAFHAETIEADLMPLLMFHHFLEVKLTRIATQVLTTQGNLWTETNGGGKIYPVTEADGGELADWYTQLLIYADRLDVPAESTPNPQQFIAGIGNLLNGNDSGQTLRRAAAEYRPVSEALFAWLEHRKAPGAKSKPVIDRLCERAKPYRDSGMPWPAIFDQLISDTADSPDLVEESLKLRDWEPQLLNRAFIHRYGDEYENRLRT